MGALPSMCRNNMTNLVESVEAAVNHARAFVPKPLLIYRILAVRLNQEVPEF